MFRQPLLHAKAAPGRVLSERGFTLLEIMVALAILGGVIVTALASISYHLTVVDSNINRTLSSMLAVEKLEQVRLYGEPEIKHGDFGPEYEGFSWTYKRARSSYPGVKTESVRVSRDDAAGVVIKAMITDK